MQIYAYNTLLLVFGFAFHAEFEVNFLEHIKAMSLCLHLHNSLSVIPKSSIVRNTILDSL